MRRNTHAGPRSADSRTLWRSFFLLCAGVLTLGFLTPIAAQAASPGQLMVKDKTVLENQGTASVRIVLAHKVNHRVSVGYKTVNGTATAGTDYTAVMGRVAFPKGTRVRHVSVPIINDTVAESTETFKVRIFDAVRARILDRTGIVTITDDDPATPPQTAPTLSVGNATATEGNALAFEVSLSKTSDVAVTFSYSTSDGSAKAPGDYTAVTNGTGTIAAGATKTVVNIQTTEDLVPEPPETMTLTLSSPVGATLADSTAVGTINDDDTAPTVSVANSSAEEGKDVVFTVSLSKASGQDVKVDYATANGSAVAPGDYTAASGTVTIPAGSTSATFAVKTVDDNTDEVNETFSVHLSSPVNATIADGHAVGTIIDNDGPGIRVSDATVQEGLAATVHVRLSDPSPQQITVKWKTEDGTAKAGADFPAGQGGTLTFAAGVTDVSFTVATSEDALDEADETFKVVLYDPVNATITDAEGQVLITDDDPTPSIKSSFLADQTVDEGATVTLHLELSAVSGRDVRIDYATANGTATAGSDYSARSGTAVIPAGQLSTDVTVPTINDTTQEGAETFFVNFSNPQNVLLAPADHQVKITINPSD